MARMAREGKGGRPAGGRPERSAERGRWGPGLDAVDRLAGRKGPCPACGAKLERDEWFAGCAICDRGTCQRCNEWSALDHSMRFGEDSRVTISLRFCSEGCALAALRRFLQSTGPGERLVLAAGGGSVVVLARPPDGRGSRFIRFQRRRPAVRRPSEEAGGERGHDVLSMSSFARRARRELRDSGRPFQVARAEG